MGPSQRFLVPQRDLHHADVRRLERTGLFLLARRLHQVSTDGHRGRNHVVLDPRVRRSPRQPRDRRWTDPVPAGDRGQARARERGPHPVRRHDLCPQPRIPRDPAGVDPQPRIRPAGSALHPDDRPLHGDHRPSSDSGQHVDRRASGRDADRPAHDFRIPQDPRRPRCRRLPLRPRGRLPFPRPFVRRERGRPRVLPDPAGRAETDSDRSSAFLWATTPRGSSRRRGSSFRRP